MSGLGNMRDRVRLMRAERLTGAGGSAQVLETLIAEVWAETTPGETALGARADRQALTGGMMVRTRYDDAFTSTDRVLWQGRRFRVSRWRATGHGPRFLEFTTEEIRP